MKKSEFQGSQSHRLSSSPLGACSSRSSSDLPLIVEEGGQAREGDQSLATVEGRRRAVSDGADKGEKCL